jgi:hypothetical protein
VGIGGVLMKLIATLAAGCEQGTKSPR